MNVALRILARYRWSPTEGGKIVGHDGVVHYHHVPRLFRDDRWLVAASDMWGVVAVGGGGWRAMGDGEKKGGG